MEFERHSVLAVPCDSALPQIVIAPTTLQLFATIAAAVSAVAAWFSSINALRFKKADKQERYYERIVSLPLMAALDEFKKAVLPLIATTTEQIATLFAVNPAQPLIETTAKKLIADVQSALQKLKDTLDTSIGAWPDQACNTALRAELERLEERVLEEIAKYSKEPQKADVRKRVLEGVAAFHVTIMEHDISIAMLGGAPVLPRRKALPPVDHWWNP